MKCEEKYEDLIHETHLQVLFENDSHLASVSMCHTLYPSSVFQGGIRLMLNAVIPTSDLIFYVSQVTFRIF